MIRKITIANTYHKYDGITKISKFYQSALDSLGYDVNYVQFTYGDSDLEYSNPEIKGIKLPVRKLCKAVNILFIFPRAFLKIDGDLFILSDPWLLKATKWRTNCILLFHDARQLTKFREGYSASLLFRYLLKFVVNVKRVIAVSDTSKEALLALSGLQSNKVSVLMNPLAKTASERTLIRKSFFEREDATLNVFYIAADQSHKNVIFFLNLAIAMLNEGSIKVKFNLVSELSKRTKAYLGSEVPAGLKIMGKIEDMDGFYLGMDLLVFPSMYEGFGLPLSEAMSFGIPIIAKDIPSIREVLGDSGVLMPNYDLELWTSKIRAFADPSVYSKYSTLSKRRSEAFNFNSFKDSLKKIIEGIDL